MDRKPIVYPGQRVITTAGQVVVVAFTKGNQVFAYRCGVPVPVRVCGDAFGGEHDQMTGLAA